MTQLAPDRRRKVVILSGFRIFPMNTGGHVRTGSIALALSRLGFDVLIYSLAGRNADYSGGGSSYRVDPIAPHLAEETNLGLGYGLLQTAGRRLDFPRVWQHSLLRHGIIPGRLRKALENADLILCDMPWVPPVPGRWSDKPWLMISHNLEYRLLAQGNGRHRRFAPWMEKIERSAPRLYRDIFTCSEEDLNFFREQEGGGERTLPIIRCGVDPEAYRVPDGVRQKIRAELGVADSERLLVFSGSGYAPNVEALQVVREFCSSHQEFMSRAGLRILVLGSVSPNAFNEGVLMATGRVPEVPPYLAAADAGLNPITRGSGANVKLFEYLAARLPVISTSFGVRGTGLQPDRDFLQYEPGSLEGTLQCFAARPMQEWRELAQEVWTRHRQDCDIEQLVRSAIVRLPEFAA
jgi:glycosyltransferase involved in cell wall biosynthesis